MSDDTESAEQECDGSYDCPARRHPPTCLKRRALDRLVERETERLEEGHRR